MDGLEYVSVDKTHKCWRTLYWYDKNAVENVVYNMASVFLHGASFINKD